MKPQRDSRPVKTSQNGASGPVNEAEFKQLRAQATEAEFRIHELQGKVKTLETLVEVQEKVKTLESQLIPELQAKVKKLESLLQDKEQQLASLDAKLKYAYWLHEASTYGREREE
jgi:vacuolar-type H+-ATPase subunit D/Vma8